MQLRVWSSNRRSKWWNRPRY